jgi:hypothetical protein
MAVRLAIWLALARLAIRIVGGVKEEERYWHKTHHHKDVGKLAGWQFHAAVMGVPRREQNLKKHGMGANTNSGRAACRPGF